ncbi:hypothetical protein LOOC260_113540 [Paucilactobacillus hokkaidonensis JCM 18461]|uniref:Uncharacterized protein n=2 Tax=Paucilactobacillus hokkaidonensis TaxID=1193095 RepID=A0A0A1GV60_9LACO|nr:hypothetical protein [Paucilactobacillus hokkaidonensis]KRO09909.1 hypothetical protein IV59_GL000216 [Paucilactobacillus hokkaidonensis]BAP85890.1 hypothetical protein LOOC260_113540 [Paucilactobacillus hokkaidonensis JCM 18461]
MKLKKKILWWLAGLLLIGMAIIIVVIFLNVSSPDKTPAKQNTNAEATVVQPAGKWSGKQKYPQNESVKLDVTFLSNKQYKLIETNTVSQCWTRTYYGGYHRTGDKIIFTPERITVNTYANKTALKSGSVAATEQIPKDQFHKQFGNQQLSKLTLQHKQIKIVHDHEKIYLSHKEVK